MGKTKMAVMDDSVKEVTKVAKATEESKVETEELKTDKLESENGELKTENKTKKIKASKRAQKKGKAKFRSAKYKEAAEKVEKSKKYGLAEAIEAAKGSSYSKFDGSMELHIGTSTKNIRGLVSLPFASGKKLKILAFGKGASESG